MKYHYICSECGQNFEITPEIMVCPDCAKKQKKDKPIRGILEVTPPKEIAEKASIFDFLPIDEKYFPPIPVGNTPMWQPENLRNITGFKNLFIKDDTLNPTGSLKDRASYLVAAFAKKYGIDQITLASTGNAASSMAGVGAAAGLRIKIYAPKNAPQAKLVQIQQYGANLHLVEGTYDEAYELSMQDTQENGGLSRNTAYNPMTIEGKKTAAIEIFQQLGKMPDIVFVSAGDGAILGGIMKGFQDLVTLKFAAKMPKIYAVQAEGSSAIQRAMVAGDFIDVRPSKTIADSISVDVPRNGYYALKMLKKHNGMSLTVTDAEILQAQKLLASTTGLFAEPAASAAFAGFQKSTQQINTDSESNFDKNSTVVILVTGSGLKDINSAQKALDLI